CMGLLIQMRRLKMTMSLTKKHYRLVPREVIFWSVFRRRLSRGTHSADSSSPYLGSLDPTALMSTSNTGQMPVPDYPRSSGRAYPQSDAVQSCGPACHL